MTFSNSRPHTADSHSRWEEHNLNSCITQRRPQDPCSLYPGLMCANHSKWLIHKRHVDPGRTGRCLHRHFQPLTAPVRMPRKKRPNWLSLAFNIIVSSMFIIKLREVGLKDCDWIKDALMDRPWNVWTGATTSSTSSLNTGLSCTRCSHFELWIGRTTTSTSMSGKQRSW